MQKLYRWFWVLTMVKAIAGVFLLLSYLTGIELLFLFKIPLVGAVAVIFLYHIKGKVFTGFFFKWILLFTIVSIVMAFYFQNAVTEKTLSHVYTILLAVTGVSFGYSFAKNYNKDLDKTVDKCINGLFWISLIIMFAYYYFYYIAGSITYFGFDSELPLAVAFYLSGGKAGYLLTGLLLIFFSGKRSPLISVALTGLLIVLRNFKITRPRNLLLVIVLFALLFGGISYAYKSGFLWRYEAAVNVDIEDEESFYVATSGRSAEFIGVLNHMNKEPIRWWLGSGIGGAYYIDIIRGDYEERFQHYTHLSLLSFIFLFGIPFTAGLVIYIIYLFVRNYKHVTNKYYLALLVTFIGATFGASMFVDPMFWVLLGVNAYMLKAPPDAVILNYRTI
jgi:hypothetical protein